MPVRIGRPQGVTGLTDIVRNPIYSTAVGLLLYGAKQQQVSNRVVVSTMGLSSFMGKIKSWIMGGNW